jgi:hypothetical protein
MGELNMKRYAIVVEKAKSNYAAYVPDLRAAWRLERPS